MSLGNSPTKVVRHYRSRVCANRRHLSRWVRPSRGAGGPPMGTSKIPGSGSKRGPACWSVSLRHHRPVVRRTRIFPPSIPFFNHALSRSYDVDGRRPKWPSKVEKWVKT